jgi:hypothetical protein
MCMCVRARLTRVYAHANVCVREFWRMHKCLEQEYI